MSHSTAPYSNIATTRGRPSSADWHNEYKTSTNLDSQHFDPSQFFDIGSSRPMKSSTTPSTKLSPAAMPTFLAASLDPASYGLGFGLENDASYAGGGASGGGGSMTKSLGPGGFGLRPGIGGAGTAATTNTTPLDSRFAALPSTGLSQPKSASMSFAPGSLGFGSGPGGLGSLGDNNGNDFAINGNDFGSGPGTASGFGFGINISNRTTSIGGIAPSPYYPPMPALGSGLIHNLPLAESWFDPSGAALHLPPAEPVEQPVDIHQQLTSQSHPFDYIGQYAFQDVVGVDDPVAAAAAEAAAVVAAAEKEAQQELTPKKPSAASKRPRRSKSTGGGGKRSTAATAKSKTTTKKKKNIQKKPSAKRPRRKAAPAAISLKDAKSKLGTNDVVMGRGGLSNNHVGNQTFLKLTKTLKPEYARLPKEEKTDVSRRLLKIVQDRGGKFLAKDAASGLFYEVDDKIARRKCSQALREESKAERAERKKRQSVQQGTKEEGDITEDGTEDEE